MSLLPYYYLKKLWRRLKASLRTYLKLLFMAICIQNAETASSSSLADQSIVIEDQVEERASRFSSLISFVNSVTIDSVASISTSQELWEVVFDPMGASKIKIYLEEGGNPNLVDCPTETGKSRSLLQLYARKGDQEMVKLLLAKGALVSYYNTLCRNVLHDACFEGNDHILSLCIEHLKTSVEKEMRNEIVSWPDTNGLTALHIASDLGKESCVRGLLKASAEVNQMAIHHVTALHFASFRGYDTIVELLLDYGADPFIRHENDFSAKDFYILGELAQEEKRNMALARRLGKPSSLVHEQRMQVIESDAALKIFKSTFQRKCSGIFLAYKALESGALQTAKGDCLIAESINIFGKMIPLPGTDFALELLGKGIEAYENLQEKKKKTFLTHMFVSIDEMEKAVEEGAYQLTHLYEYKIKDLTSKGSYTLAMCAIGQFLDYMRGNVELNASHTLSSYILSGVKAPRPSFLDNILPATWLHQHIETKDNTLRWTQRDVFDIQEEKLGSAIIAVQDIVPVLVELSADHVGQSLNIQNTLDVVNQLQEGRSWRRILCCCVSHIAKG